jgi:hypothetical protein
MYGLGHEHENERQHERNDVNPKCIAKEVQTKNTDKCTANVAAEQRARLRCGRARQTK